jgi:cell wall-associated NlpC family hydrolase
VQADERLRDIAAQEKVDLGALIDFNNIDDPELIHPGQVVMIPPAGQQAASISQPAAVPVPAPAQATGQHSAPPARANDQQSAAPAPQPGPAASKPGSDNSLAALGVKFVGTRYIWGGSSPSGFDCSGLVWYVARQAGKPISRGMLGQYNSGPHPGRNELKPGDMVFFQNTYTPGLSHNGMYLGNGQFVHAADERDGVTISSLSAPYWAAHWFGATRLP